jgi:hypothetical protein
MGSAFSSRPEIVAAWIQVFGTVIVAILSAGAGMAFQQLKTLVKENPDKEAFWIWRLAFDRRAFRDKFQQEVDMAAFGQALQDLDVAVVSGEVYTRDGKKIGQGTEYARLKEPRLRTLMGDIRKRILDVQNYYREYHSLGWDEQAKRQMLEHKIDNWRNSILDDLNREFRRFGIPELPLI